MTKGQIGQIMICLDGGMASHYAAVDNILQASPGLKVALSVRTDRLDVPGFLSTRDLQEMARENSVQILNGSRSCLWNGRGESPNRQNPASEGEILQDILSAADCLKGIGTNPSYVVVPWGTAGATTSSLLRMMEYFRWIRLSVGCPVEDYMGTWHQSGGPRLWPRGHAEQLIGVSAFPDARVPERMSDAIENAARLGKLAVLAFGNVSHVIGQGSEILWEEFLGYLDLIERHVEDGELECVLPRDLVE